MTRASPSQDKGHWSLIILSMLPNCTLTNIVTVSLRNFQYKCVCHHSKPINAQEVTKLL